MNPFDEYTPNFSGLIEATDLHRTLKDFAELLEYISGRIFSTPTFESHLKGRILSCHGIDASIYSLRGIEQLCSIGDIVDAAMLVRKIRDNLFLDLFLISCSQDWDKTDLKMPDLDELLSDSDLLVNMLNEFTFVQSKYETNNKYKIAINKWREGKLTNNQDKQTKREFFGFDKYLNYLKNDKVYEECCAKYLKKHFDILDVFLNDFAHSNSPNNLNNYAYTVSNKLPELYKQLNQAIITLKYLFIISMYLINSVYFQTEDYEDCLEFTHSNPEGLQYNVIYDILEIFDVIKSKDINLFNYLLEHNKNCMKMRFEDYEKDQ